MGAQPRILAFAGSLRRDSYNKKLLHIAADAARSAGSTVTEVDLRDYRMPIYDEDDEKAEGLPMHAVRFKALFGAHDGLLIAAPEYNSSITAVLKNVIDWVSRPVPGEPAFAAFTGKAAVLMSASPGALGGLRGLVHVRSILGNLGVLVLPEQLAIARAFEAFADDGALKDAKLHAGVQNLGKALATLLVKLHA